MGTRLTSWAQDHRVVALCAVCTILGFAVAVATWLVDHGSGARREVDDGSQLRLSDDSYEVQLSNGTDVDITKPVVAGVPGAPQINSRISKLLDEWIEEAAGWSPVDTGEGGHGLLHADYRVFALDESAISLVVSGTLLSPGGASPTTLLVTETADPLDGSRLDLSDFFVRGTQWQPRVSQAVCRALDEDHGTDARCLDEVDALATSNFAVDTGRLHFFFSECEVVACAAGAQHVSILHDEVGSRGLG